MKSLKRISAEFVINNFSEKDCDILPAHCIEYIGRIGPLLKIEELLVKENVKPVPRHYSPLPTTTNVSLSYLLTYFNRLSSDKIKICWDEMKKSSKNYKEYEPNSCCICSCSECNESLCSHNRFATQTYILCTL